MSATYIQLCETGAVNVVCIRIREGQSDDGETVGTWAGQHMARNSRT
jgi:hypothetical protein